ncbi:MAG TPA: TIGR00730 family Rossman fold protein [Cytophagales bacterium]|jgi:hypothetical protein
MKRIVVFCGSSGGHDPVFAQEAFGLGQYLAESGIELVYGGAKVGLMGAVADGVLQGGGRVIGVLPHFLRTKEVAHQHLTELILVDTMHERKLKMHELSDGVIALPGGYGTLEELFEMLTWGQLGLHAKPVGLLNTDGFYDYLLALADSMTRRGFLKEENRRMLLIDNSAADLLAQMRQYRPPTAPKWITKEQT